MVYVIKYKNI